MDSAAHTADRRLAGRLLEAARSSPDTVETHVSTVVFDGELVHKLKKAVRFPFVDLSTAERRAEMCHREVALNRRFASDVYLGVEDIVDDVGTVIDHAVLMRRMPADRRLAALVSQGHDVSACLRAVARAIAVCHARAPTSPVIASVAAPAALHELWARNLAELTPFAGLLVNDANVARIGELAHRYLDGRSALLTERIADGRVVDGHGDLLADDIFCLDDGPRILDCLEFDDRLRWGDVLYDVGFLAMDLERLGRADLGTSFLDSYREYAGETHPPSLEHHYIAYRALVRAKIACLRGEAAEARRYLDQCQRHLNAARVQLVVIGGLPGTGKSTLAAAIGGDLGWTVLRTDEIRKELAGLDPRQEAVSAYNHGLYAPAMTESVYTETLARAGTLLDRGSSVIVDGTFSKECWRAAATALAASHDADLHEICCVLPADVAADRLAHRTVETDDPSDATPAIAARMADQSDAWPSADAIDTSTPLTDVIPTVLGRLGFDRR